MTDDSNAVHTFWHGGELPPLAHFCLQSFLEHGHDLRIHAYQPIRAPEGARVEDARDLVSDEDPMFAYAAPGTIAAFSDYFRYQLLHRRGGWWVDTDVYCLSDTLPDQSHVWAEEEAGVVNNAILKFPWEDPLLARLVELARDRAFPQMPWGALGPRLTTEVLAASDAADAAALGTALYPVHWIEAHFPWLPEFREEVATRTADAKCLHLWRSTLDWMGIDSWRPPPAGSFLATLPGKWPQGTPVAGRPRSRNLRLIQRFLREEWVKDHCVRHSGWDLEALTPAAVSGGRRFGWVVNLASARPVKSIQRRVKAFRMRALEIPLAARRAGARVPPGSLAFCQEVIDSEQHFFLERARALGPIFKVTMWGSYTTCVVGHERAARLVSEHSDSLTGVTIDLRRLFPLGALRAMSGEVRGRYRRLFSDALQSTPLAVHGEAVQGDIRAGLAGLAAAPTLVGGDELRDRLRRILTTIMLRFLFGITPESPEFPVLEAAYRRFGRQAPVSRIGDEQVEAFAIIIDQVRGLVRQGRGGPSSYLGHMAASGRLDETALGNLAYMFEPSHFDVYSLWHWILRFIGIDPELVSAYRACSDAESRRTYARALVQETLRMEQGELLLRNVTADIVFDGFFIPRGTTLRACIWEGHKDPAHFEDPFRFAPDRFLGRSYGPDQYAPFGLGPQRCLGSNLVLDLSTLFVQELLDGYDLHVTGDGPPHRGPYHWQPNQELAVELVARLSAT